MEKIFTNDTICAIATAAGPAGVGIVRISGRDAKTILEGLWRGKVSVSDFSPRQLYFGEINGAHPIDRVLAVHMPAPGTYTGEDVVEIHAHGSPHILNKILEALTSRGARIAMPGEFTRRAFLAGKMDLAEAEGVADLINATSERAAKLANEQISGRLSKTIRGISEKLADLRSELEATIDFPEEEDVIVRNEIHATERVAKILAGVNDLLSTYTEGRLIREGAAVAIVGRPNAGKSSIFNLMVGRERAIVHHEPGTTRDIVDESVLIKGMAFKIKDTAGMRSGAGEVETMGMERSREEIAAADVVVAVFDGSREFGEEDRIILEITDPKKTIFVINKNDLPQRFDDSLLLNPVKTSVVTGLGLDEIQKRLTLYAGAHETDGDTAIVANIRHKTALEEALAALEKAAASISCSEPAECAAISLKQSQDALSKITGEVTDDDILDRVFSKFCIGK